MYDRFGEAAAWPDARPRAGRLLRGAAVGSATCSTPSSAAAPSVAAHPARPALPVGRISRSRPASPSRHAVFGTTLPVTVKTAVRCETCDGQGTSPGTQPVTCAECAGAGQVRRVRQSLLGQMVTTSACPRCGGSGQLIVTPCEACAGHGRLSRGPDLPGGRAGRRRQRLHAPPLRARRGRSASAVKRATSMSICGCDRTSGTRGPATTW